MFYEDNILNLEQLLHISGNKSANRSATHLVYLSACFLVCDF